VAFQSLISTKAARSVEVAGGRAVVEFGTRRAHTPEAGVVGARAAYIGGCAGTSNTLAGFRYGIPVMGTSAHSWVMSFPGELEAFRQLQRVLGDATVQLIDTYDTLEGARRAAGLGRPLWGVRIDSGDFLALSRQVRAILDEAGLPEARIMASGDLDEYRIRDLVNAGAPIDSFGVGTQLATSADAPALSAIYKMVELEFHGIQRFTAKYSAGKISLPGSKQIFREEARDVVARSGECGKGEALLRPVILGGRLVEPLPTVEQARRRAAESLAKLPPALRQLEVAEPWPVVYSRELRALIDRTRSNVAG
jgi:nicotinate phosphoribosyltransferase